MRSHIAASTAPPRLTGCKASALLAIAASLLLAASAVPAEPVNKCVLNGTVSYQQDPCPTGQVRKQPALDALNAAEKKRKQQGLAEAAAKAAPATAPAPDRAAPAAHGLTAGFSCDGRRYCSQMRSCAEAKYFLAHCPGVKMDGDRNGIPCEQQWCGH